MANCPVCNGDISDDFGLIECPSCAAPLIVHMDGRVEHSGSDAMSSDTPEVPFGSEFPDPHTELAAISALPLDDATQMLQAEEPFAVEEPFAAEEPAPEIYQAPQRTAGADSSDLSDIARFGNSGISANDGSLRYNIFISGIDTADVREAFREAITDRKLVWDIDQILRSLKNGEVRIADVTPPKAFILISRLRNIPVQVRWEQYALSQAQT